MWVAPLLQMRVLKMLVQSLLIGVQLLVMDCKLVLTMEMLLQE